MKFYYDDNRGTDQFTLQDFEPSFGAKMGAAVDEAWLESYGPTLTDWLRSRNDGSPKLSAQDAASRIKSSGLRVNLTPKDGEYSSRQLDVILERQRELTKAKDVRERTPWDLGSPLRGVAMFGAGIADPINLATAFFPSTRLVGGMLGIRAATKSASAVTRFGARAAVGAADAGISTAVIEPFYYGMRQSLGDDYTAVDSMANIAFGAAFGGGIHSIGGVGVDMFRRAMGMQQPWQTNVAPAVTGDTIIPPPASMLMGRDVSVRVGDQYEPGQWAVVDADTLTATVDKADNQFRDRGRAAYQAEITARANALDPALVLSVDTPLMDVGTPTIAADGRIIGGNGRTLFIQRAYEIGKAGDYRAELERRLADLGIDPEAVRGMNRPVLVRRLSRNVDVKRAAMLSNEGGSTAMSPLEQAKVDSERLGDAQLETDADGNLDTAGNRAAIRRWVNEQPEGQRNALMTEDGRLSASGLQRLRNAVLFKAYGDSPTLARLIEATDVGSRNVAAALARTAGVVADAEGSISRGELHPLSIAADIRMAVEQFDNLRRQGMKVADYLAQVDMLGDPLTPEGRLLLDFMSRNIVSSRRIGDAISGYYAKLQEAGNPGQGDMFGGVSPDKMGMLRAATEAVDSEPLNAAETVAIISPDTREAALGTAVGQAIDGRSIDVAAIVNTDPAVGGTSTAADVVASAERNQQPEAIRTADFDAAAAVDRRLATAPKWDALSDAEAASAEAETLLNDTIKAGDQAFKYSRGGDNAQVTDGGQVLEQGGKYTESQLQQMDTDVLDRMAWGVVNGDVVDVSPASLNVQYTGDMENPEAKFAKDGMKWVKSVDLSEPIKVSIRDDGKLYIEDGHHRYFAATKLGKSLKAEIEVKGNPVAKILKDQQLNQAQAPAFDGPETGNTPIGDAQIVNVDGVERPALNSKGQPIHPTLEGVRNFWRWFGDSKVVDADGKPLVVYHGTVSDFTQFSAKFQGAVTRATSSKSGFFFTSSPRTAESYANHGALVAPVQKLIEEADKAGERGNWDKYDAKIAEAEALEAKLSDPANRGRGQNVMPVYLSLQNPLIIDAKGENPEGIGGIDPLIQKAKRAGHDGVIIRNFDDAANIANDNADHFIIFKDTQVKSATGNRGTFDPTNPDIRYSREIPLYQQGITGHPAVDVIETSIRQSFGDATDALLQRGQIQIVATPADIPGGPHPGDVKAATAPDGTVYMVASNISEADARGLVLHEVGVHVGMEQMLGRDVFQSVLGQLDDAIMRGDDWAQAARDAVPKGTNPAHVREEQLAYLVQNAPDLIAAAKDAGARERLVALYDAILAAVRAWAYRTFEFARERMTLTEADFRAMAVAALHDAVRRGDRAGVGAMAPAGRSVGGLADAYTRGSDQLSEALSEIEALVAKYKDEFPVYFKGSIPDFDRGAARIVEKYWNELSGRTQEFIGPRIARDWETGEQIQAVDSVRGTHIFDLYQELENREFVSGGSVGGAQLFARDGGQTATAFDAQAAFEKYGGNGDINESTDITAKSNAFSDMAEAEGYSVAGRGDKYLTIKKFFGKTEDGYDKEVILNVRISDHSNINRAQHFGELDINIAPDDGHQRHTFENALDIIRSAYVDEDLNTVIPGSSNVSLYRYSRGSVPDPSTSKDEMKSADEAVKRAKSYASVLRAAADKLENDAEATAAMRAALPDITPQEIDDLLGQLRKQVTGLRSMARATRSMLDAEDTAAGMQDEAMRAADMLANNLQMAAVIEKRNAALNLNVRLKASSFVNQFRDKGLDFEGFAALLTGSQRVRSGARLSVDAEYKGFRGEWMGGMIADIEKLGLWREFVDGAFDRDIYDALHRMGTESPDFTGLPKEAVDLAKVVNKYQTDARNTRNRFGAWIRDLKGYITRQSHDMFKIRDAGEQDWVAYVKERIDVAKMTRLGLISENDPMSSLRTMYDDFAAGVHMKAAAGEDDTAAFGVGSNLAKRESVSRVLYFKDGIAAFEYNERFGQGRLADSVLSGLEASARSSALLKTLGTNPEATLTRLLNEYENSLVGDPARRSKFRAQRGAIMNMLAQVDGSTLIPGNVTAAKVGTFVRAWTAMTRLGGALISSFTDLAGYGAELRYQGSKNLFSGVLDGIGRATQGRAKGEQRQVLASLGVFHESVIGAVAARFDSPELTGRMAWGMQQFFKWNGLNWWTESLRDGAALSHSHYLAQNAGKSFDKLDGELQRLLSLYNIDAGKWDLLRLGTMKMADGRAYMTPDALATVPRAALENYIQLAGRTVNDATVQNLLDDLSQILRVMSVDRAHHAVLEPNARARTWMLRGTKPGTVPGEILRYIGQFKSFSVAMIQMVLGREIYGRGYDTLGEYLKKGKGDMLGLATMIGLYTAFGYAAMSIKDMLKGREPRPVDDPRTWYAAMAQGGGLGLYGDFLFGEYSRMGRTFTASLAGPVIGNLDTLADLMTRARNGDDMAGSAFKALLDNTPFMNLFYLRPVLDYLVLYQIQEALNPGFLRRMEGRIMRDNSQEFIFPPSQYARGV